MEPPSDLGEPVRIFDGRPVRRSAVTWLIALVVGVAALVPAAVMAFLAGHAWLGAPTTLLAMGCAAAAGWIAGQSVVWRRARTVHLFTGGLLITPAPHPHTDTTTTAAAPTPNHPTNPTTNPASPSAHDRAGAGGEVFLWDDLVSVTVSGVQAGGAVGGVGGLGAGVGAGSRTRWRFTVVAQDGRVVRLGEELPDVRVLGEIVAAEVTRRAVPRHLATVKAGEAVRLGPFTVDLDGVEKDGQRVPWPDVRDVEIGGGLVTVRARGGRPELVAIAGHMPDAFTFTLLCTQVRAMIGPF